MNFNNNIKMLDNKNLTKMIFNDYSLTERNQLCNKLNNSQLLDIAVSLDKKLEHTFISDPKQLIISKTLTNNSSQKFSAMDSKFATFTTFKGKRYIAWATSERVIEVYDTDLEKVYVQLHGHKDHILSVRQFNVTNKDYLVSTSTDCSCKVWTFSSRIALLTLRHAIVIFISTQL
jgi:WD40 repeat protein